MNRLSKVAQKRLQNVLKLTSSGTPLEDGNGEDNTDNNKDKDGNGDEKQP